MTEPLRVLSLFAGIGGLDLGLERTGGFETTAFVEIDPFCQRVLRKHWPHVPVHSDVREFHAQEGEFDLIAGGFPCQPVSLAGKRRGQDDERWLWPEFARLVGEARPRYVLVENVPGLASKGLRDVLADLSALRYDAEWQVVSAASVGAPHLRERIFVVAYPAHPNAHGGGCEIDAQLHGSTLQDTPDRDSCGTHAAGLCDAQGAGPMADPDCSAGVVRERTPSEAVSRSEEIERPRRCGRVYGDVQDADGGSVQSWRLGWRTPQAGSGGVWTAEPDVGRVAHGVPKRLDRLRSLGNAVVPQCAQFVGELILNAEASG